MLQLFEAAETVLLSKLLVDQTALEVVPLEDLLEAEYRTDNSTLAQIVNLAEDHRFFFVSKSSCMHSACTHVVCVLQLLG